VRALLTRALRPALLGGGLLLLGGCRSTTHYEYRAFDRVAIGEPETCDQVCEESVSYCGVVEDCSRSGRPDACEAVALEVPPEGGLMECVEERWEYEGPTGFGRCPIGGEPGRSAGRGAGAFFARMALHEAAAVDAFEELSKHLRAHGAPPPLVAACRRAASEERVHARLARLHAARLGVRAPDPAPTTGSPVPSLVEIARHNAAEGCVGEAYGVLLLAQQAANARDASVRGAMARIARDEASHAALSWAIDGWARAGLSRGAREEIEEARFEAARRLVREPGTVGPGLGAQVGLPGPAARRELATAFRACLVGAAT
jgi:hypothetical protein